MRRLLRSLAIPFVVFFALRADAQAPASPRALVYCPVPIDATGCDRIVTALAASFTVVDRGYDGRPGTVDLASVNLDAYAVFVVPSLADDAGVEPYSVIRNAPVASRLKGAFTGRVAVWSGTPDQGEANREAKNTLLRNLAGWAAARFATSGARGIVVLQDHSADVAQRYAWVATISGAAVLADASAGVYDTAEPLTTDGTEILGNGATQVASHAYANMASFGLHLPANAAGMLVGALGGSGSRQVVLATYETGATGPAELYIQAHQDDWQLFAGNRTAASTRTASKVVFVYTTAGDAGSTTHYWQSRERAAKASVDAITAAGEWTCGPQAVGSHTIHRCAKANTVSYFLRLPDGNGEGQGYQNRGSLAQLRGLGRSIAALDASGTPSATYTSWDDLVATIRAIAALELAGQPGRPIVHAPEWEVAVNGGDHSDHVATGDLVRAASWGQSWNLFWYLGYPNIFEEPNISASEHDIKWSTIVAYDDAIKGDYGSILGQRTEDWSWRTIYRGEISTGVIPQPSPVAALSSTAVGATINLAWDPFAGAQEYRVERAPNVAGAPGGSAGVFIINATLGGNQTSWSQADLPEHAQFYYRVRARTSSGWSAYSTELAATTGGACIAPAFSAHPAAATATSGQAVTFSASATGTGVLNHQWRKDGIAIPDATNGSLEIDPVSAEDAGSYDVVVSNDCGSVTSSSAVLTVVRATAAVTLSGLSPHTYDGTPKTPSVTTSPAGLNVSVTYSLDGSVVSTPVGAGDYAVTATIVDNDYQGSTTGTLTIAKAVPSIAWATPASITHGTPLSGAQLSAAASGVGGSPLAGSFVYSLPDGTLLSAGTYTLTTTFTPNDLANYTGAHGGVTVEVRKAAPGFTDLTSATISYGTGSVILSGTISAGSRAPT
jgi:hypothetical protein